MFVLYQCCKVWQSQATMAKRYCRDN